MHEGTIKLDSNVVQEKFGRKTIAGIDDDVVARAQPSGSSRRHTLDESDDAQARIETPHTRRGDLGFASADVGCTKERLAIQVRPFDDIVIAQRQGANASRGQLGNDGSAEATTTDDGDAGDREATLTGQADLRHNELTGIPVDDGHTDTEA
jgi:hypothetical protein